VLRSFLLFTLVLIFSVAIYLYFFLGFLKPVHIADETRTKVLTLGKPHLGAYHEILPTIEAVEQFAKDNKIPCPKTFGHYLDDPDRVDVPRLRSVAGCIVPEVGGGQNLPPDMQPGTIPSGRYLVATFEGSPSIGPFVVYPKVKAFAQEHGLKIHDDVFEVYTIDNMSVRTEFLFSIDPMSPPLPR